MRPYRFLGRLSCTHRDLSSLVCYGQIRAAWPHLAAGRDGGTRSLALIHAATMVTEVFMVARYLRCLSILTPR